MDNTNVLTTIRLTGELGKTFGRVHKFAVNSAAEAVRAMCTVFPGFKKHLVESKDRGIGYAVFVDKRNISKEELQNPVLGKELKFVPIVRGSKSGGVLQTVLGVVLIVVGVVIDYVTAGAGGNQLIMMGAAMALGGIVQLLSPQQKVNQSQNPANGTSYNFSGPVNTTAQGNPVPVLYGRMIVGSAVISGGIYAQDQA